jgi:hypothetical protein
MISTYKANLYLLQGNGASLQLVPASTTTKANRANKHESAVLQTAGVAGTGVRLEGRDIE